MPGGAAFTVGAVMNSAQTRRVIAAGVIGNLLEWYDFTIYSYFTSAISPAVLPS
jgi:MHS family proline/betaine transporter-like MFS transporter